MQWRVAQEERQARGLRSERGEISREDVEAAKVALIGEYGDGCTTRVAIKRALQKDASLSAAMMTFGPETYRHCALLAGAGPAARQ
jgi:hypothetical protein